MSSDRRSTPAVILGPQTRYQTSERSSGPGDEMWLPEEMSNEN